MNVNITEKELQLIQQAHYLNTHPWVIVLFLVLAVWSIAWKGVALWKAAKNNQTVWYVVMLIINTVGILEIVYIYFFSKKKRQAQ